MRYFLVTFSLSDKFSLGTICFEHDGFFSYNQLLLQVQKQHPYAKGIVVVNIHEFRNESDYKTYLGETKRTEFHEYLDTIKQIAMHTFFFSYEQTGFITEQVAADYYRNNIPAAEALKDIMAKRLG
jgi:hypothetical protein